MATRRVRISAARRTPGVIAEIADLFRSLALALFDPYRPELHYMRGPGPKWRAKHAATSRPALSRLAPVLIAVRVER